MKVNQTMTIFELSATNKSSRLVKYMTGRQYFTELLKFLREMRAHTRWGPVLAAKYNFVDAADGRLPMQLVQWANGEAAPSNADRGAGWGALSEHEEGLYEIQENNAGEDGASGSEGVVSYGYHDRMVDV